MSHRVIWGGHPCAFCLNKDNLSCSSCAEQFQAAFMEEDVSDDFLIAREMSYTEFSGVIFIQH